MSKPGSEALLLALHFSSPSVPLAGTPQCDRGRIALARFGSSVIVIAPALRQASEGKRG